MRHTFRFVQLSLFAAVCLALLTGTSTAYEFKINFDGTNPPPLPFDENAPVAGDITYVPTTLPGASGSALRCRVPAGGSEYYCGFDVLFDGYLPLTNEAYIRYYVKFEPTWKFSTNTSYYKNLIIEPMPGGQNDRTFLNFNTDTINNAHVQATIYAGTTGWHDTGVDIQNNNVWHCVEVHVLKNLADPPNGRLRIWWDGRLVMDRNPENMGNSNISKLTFGYRNGNAQNDMWMQWEEVVIADHYVGPIGSSGASLAPSTPSDLWVR